MLCSFVTTAVSAVRHHTICGGRVTRRRRRRQRRSNEARRLLLTCLCTAGLCTALLHSRCLCAVRLRNVRRWATFLLPLPLPQLCQHPKRRAQPRRAAGWTTGVCGPAICGSAVCGAAVRHIHVRRWGWFRSIRDGLRRCSAAGLPLTGALGRAAAAIAPCYCVVAVRCCTYAAAAPADGVAAAAATRACPALLLWGEKVYVLQSTPDVHVTWQEAAELMSTLAR